MVLVFWLKMVNPGIITSLFYMQLYLFINQFRKLLVFFWVVQLISSCSIMQFTVCDEMWTSSGLCRYIINMSMFDFVSGLSLKLSGMSYIWPIWSYFVQDIIMCSTVRGTLKHGFASSEYNHRHRSNESFQPFVRFEKYYECWKAILKERKLVL